MNKQALPPQPLGITELLLRDAHQSLLATRWRTDDMLPLCAALDKVGYWSVECWGGATYDACLRFLGEDPWARLASFRRAMPNTRLQMLLRGRNLLGYKHYTDYWVGAFVEHCAEQGIDVFRIFDALNDVDNIAPVVAAVRACGKHAQGTMSYTLSPVHDLQYWLDLGQRIADLGVDSLAIKDMAGLLAPYDAYALVSALKERLSVPIHMQCHATTGLSSATYIKAIEAGIDNVDTAISTMSMTYGHSSTEAIAYMFRGTGRDPQLHTEHMAMLAEATRPLRARYRAFEGSLRGVDARILTAQVPGGMLSNLENQLRQQQAAHRLGEVLEEVPKVRADLGYIPLVTPTSQIVGTQALLNVVRGRRYATVTQEVQALVRGDYGRTPAPVSAELRQRLGNAPATESDDPDSMQAGVARLRRLLRDKGAPALADDKDAELQVLSHIMFPQVTEKFLCHRDDPTAFELPPADAVEVADGQPDAYLVTLAGEQYTVVVSAEGSVQEVHRIAAGSNLVSAPADSGGIGADTTCATMAGVVLAVKAQAGDAVQKDQVVLLMEALKMEIEIPAPRAGTLAAVQVSKGQNVAVGDPLFALR